MKGHLPVFSVGTEEEAHTLIVATCAMGLDRKYYAEELGREQTLENLEVFSEKLDRVHDRLIELGKCTCKETTVPKKATKKRAVKKAKATTKTAPKPCSVKQHFECDGTGQKCNRCGESEAACRCEDSELVKCEDCDGTGRFCVEHESPVGDLREKVCDKMKGGRT